MKTKLWIAGMLLFLVLAPGIFQAATLSWNPPTTYTDGSGILFADQGRISYTPYYSDYQTGPWVGSTATFYTYATMPDPSPGGVLWYTADCTLDGQTSAKAGAVSKGRPFPLPSPPTGVVVQ